MIHKGWLILLITILGNCSLEAADKKLKDPTRPPDNIRTKLQHKKIKLILSEIRINENDRQAVINGKRLRKGNSIANYRLRKIEVGYVILGNDKGTMRLNLINNRIIRKNL